MNLKFENKKGEEEKIYVNEEWISHNKKRITDWIEKNKDKFENDKPRLPAGIFYKVHDTYVVFALSFSSDIPRGNIAVPIDFNQSPEKFAKEVNWYIKYLCCQKEGYIHVKKTKDR